MTAIVQPLPRNGWSNSQTDLNMSTDEVSRMFVPRKSAQRSNSSSSLSSTASSASSTSTISATSTAQPNGLPNGDTNGSWAKKKPSMRAIWAASSKAEPVAGLSTARTQTVSANAAGPSAASAISALHMPSYSANPASNQPQPQQQQQQLPNGVTNRNTVPPDVQTQLHLQPLNGTFERKTIKIPFAPDLVRIGRQTNNKTLPTPENGYFDSKVLSRQHAEVWADREGRVWIRDVKSSNGTFVNGKRLSQENRDSEPHPLNEADVLELGIDIVSEDQKTVVHHKVAARVDHAGLFTTGADAADFSESDIPISNGMPNQNLNQNARSRPASQGANNGNGRFNGAGVAVSSVPTAAYQSKWLQPVTMEQIVKRLNNELKQARVQSSNIRQSSSYVKAANAGEKPPPPRRGIMSPPKSLDKPRVVSLPPAPPPSVPPPDAPLESILIDNSEESMLQPILRRSDTERPQSSGSPPSALPTSPTKAEQSSQILKLLEALGNAEKEIASQGEKLSEMEAALNKEREERKIAEERADKLESTAAVIGAQDATIVQKDLGAAAAGVANDQQIPELDTTTLQQRLDLLRAEMDHMKTQMERYRERAENAEHDSQQDRKSLAEMVESIKKRDEAARRKADKKKKSPKLAESTVDHSLSTDQEDREIEQLDEELGKEAERARNRLLAISFSEGSLKHAPNGGVSTSDTAMSIAELQQLGKAAIAAAMGSDSRERDIGDDGDLSQLVADTQTKQRSRRQEQLAQTAPYASMLGVILLGMGLMAYLNGWQKVVER